MTAEPREAPSVDRPFTLVAELTYRCPLRCGYCSNPLDHAKRPVALDASDWAGVLARAADLGVLAVHLTGGEPLLRADLEAIVESSRSRDLFTTLVTSGVPLTPARLSGLRDRGLDAIQLSLQDADPSRADASAGGAWHAHKLEVARWTLELGIALTINVVLHRGNIDRVPEIVRLATELRASRLELANVQLLGWALRHRDALLPSRSQIERARVSASQARERLAGRMDVVFVLPDYHSGTARACMDGWARRHLVVTPDGLALPCHAAHALPGLAPPSIKGASLETLWSEAPLFRAFRGEEWMREPCRSCERRALDFGGCRCQALALTGDAAAPDPACAMVPQHALVRAARAAAESEAAAPGEVPKRGR